MSEDRLHSVVGGVARSASSELATRAASGSLVQFDLVELASPGGGSPLYTYQPRSRDFIEAQIDGLRPLEEWQGAGNVLADFDGPGDYLPARGEAPLPIDPRERADLVLRVFLAAMHYDSGDFIYSDERFVTARDELTRCVMAG